MTDFERDLYAGNINEGFRKGVEWVVLNLRKGKELEKHIVVSNDLDKGIEYVEDIIGDDFIVKSVRTHYFFKLETIDKAFTVVTPKETYRGYRCHKLHVDYNLKNNDIIKNVFEPMIRSSKGEIVYFDEDPFSELDKSIREFREALADLFENTIGKLLNKTDKKENK